MIAELAVSCGLLIAAGLMIKSVVQLKTVPMPFAVDDILTARVDLPRDGYPDSAASIRFFEQLLPKLAAVPGVEAATLSDGLPAAGNGSIPVQLEGKAYQHDSDYPLAREGIVTPGYFETFETPVLSGRAFTTADTATGQPVAVVNESFVRVHYAGQDPVGRQMKRIRPNGTEPWMTIVGVVPDLLMQGIGNNNASPVGYYIPIAQSDVANGVRIAVRTRGEATAITPLRAVGRRGARSGPGDLRGQFPPARDRPADLVLHDLRHVLHGLRDLRAVSRRGWPLRRDVVRGVAAHARDGRALGPGGAGPRS